MNKYAVTIIHGSKEHWGRYKEFMTELKIQGIDSHTGDLAAHGNKFNGKSHNFTFREMLNSAIKIIDETKAKYPEHKQIIFGHSMGSFIVKHIVYNNIRKFDGVILSGTNDLNSTVATLGMITTSIAKKMVWRLNENISYGTLVRASEKMGYTSNWLSSDLDSVKEFNNDPLCGNNFTNGSLNAMYKFMKLNGINKTFKNFGTKNIPQLFIYGEEDPVANFGKDIERLVAKQKKYDIHNITVKKYEGCKHEVLFDKCSIQATIDIVSFIKNIFDYNKTRETELNVHA